MSNPIVLAASSLSGRLDLGPRAIEGEGGGSMTGTGDSPGIGISNNPAMDAHVDHGAAEPGDIFDEEPTNPGLIVTAPRPTAPRPTAPRPSQVRPATRSAAPRVRVHFDGAHWCVEHPTLIATPGERS